jgi:hypothetical protein
LTTEIAKVRSGAFYLRFISGHDQVEAITGATSRKFVANTR